jgi:hypothetical protein
MLKFCVPCLLWIVGIIFSRNGGAQELQIVPPTRTVPLNWTSGKGVVMHAVEIDN